MAVTGYSARRPVFYFYALAIFILYLAGILTYLLLKSRRKKTSKAVMPDKDYS